MTLRFNAKRALATLILLLAATDFVMPVAAMEVTSGDVLSKVNGNYGADLANVTGATINTDLTTATITNTQTNSVLNWNNLNTAPNQTLNFVMKDGQTSLNNVIGTGLSKFAGTINSENGRLIISNPNGMIFENGSFVNANALILTTHNAVLDNNGSLRVYSPDKNVSIKFQGGNNKVKFNIANDLSIISNNIDINNANIIAGDTKLVTADGITFYSVNNNNPNYSLRSIATNGDANIGTVNVKNSTFAVKDNSTGKISIVSKAGVLIDNNANFNGDTKIEANDKVAIYKSNFKNLDVKSNSTRTNGDAAIIVYNSKGDNLNLTANNGKARVNNNSQFKSIKAAAAEIHFNDVVVNNGELNATKRINASGITLNKTKMNSDTVEISNSTVTNSIINATNLNALASNISNTEATIANNIYTTNNNSVGAVIKNSKLTAGNEMRLANSTLDNTNIEAKSVKLNDANLLNNTKLSTKNITDNADNLTIKNSTLNIENGNVSLVKSILENANVTASNGNIYVETQDIVSGNFNAKGNFQAKSSNWKKQLTFDNANIVAGGNVKLMSKPNFSNSTISTTGAKSVVEMQNANISNSNINTFNIYGQTSTIANSILNATNDIIVSNSNITNSALTATKDLKLENTNLNKVSANGRYAFLNNAVLENGTNLVASRLSTQGTNDYQTGNIVYKAGMTVENLTIKDSIIKVADDVYLRNAKLDNATIETTAGKSLNIDTTSDIKLTGINIGGDLNITQAGNVEITNSQLAGGTYIPELAAGKESKTDYDRTKFTNDYFRNIIQENGTDYGRNLKLSEIKGNVNIGNANNSLIINTIIGGNLEVGNIVGDANLITSLVEGNYSPARETISNTNVYESFINGEFSSNFDYQLASADSQLASADTQTLSTINTEDHNRNKYGNDVNTTFKRIFSPRGFAAAEDELSQMKSQVKSVKKGNKIQISKDFYAY